MNIDAIIKELTLHQKAALLQGWTQWTTMPIPRLGIPELFMADGPHGVCKQTVTDKILWSRDTVPSTCFPTSATMANSWDVQLGEEMGRALGKEAAAADVHVLLGPGLNMKRTPLCGRNFEYFSEDPYLAGKMAAAYIRGIQESGTAACPKHFAVNSQELRRMAMDAIVDERTLREIYLTAFEIAVKEGKPKAIMSAYNMVNGTYANENHHLLTEILRDEWGFDGIVVTDWGADNDHAAGVAAGSNVVMPTPGPDGAIGIMAAVEEGRLSEADIDRRLRELLSMAIPTAEAVSAAPKTFDAEAHHALAKKCAAESIVLLDNDGILPLNKGANVAIIGDFARTPRYQGAGSSLVKTTRLDCFYDCAEAVGLNVIGYAQGYRRDTVDAEPQLIEEAVKLAKSAEIVLLCVGLDETTESEGMDRRDLELAPSQQSLISAVSAANPNLILLLSGGAPFIMPKRNLYRAAIHGYLGGQAGGSAMANAIVGNVNPCGKLSETWPLRIEDTPAYPYSQNRQRTFEYREALYVGYRYYDSAGVPIRYPFGHGLSYTTFEYSDLAASVNEVSFTLKNTGTAGGAEIAQVYVSCPEGKIFRPRKELKGFAKVFLKAGESRRVSIALDDKAFRYFNVKTNAWETESGSYEISVAACSADVRLSQSIYVHGSDAPLPYTALPCYESGQISAVPDDEFAALLGRAIPDGTWGSVLGINDALCQLRLVKTVPAQLVYKIVRSRKEKGEKQCPPDLNSLFIYNMTFRSIAKLTNGAISFKMAEDLCLALNGHFFRGAGRFILDFLRSKRQGKAFLRELDRQK